MARTHLMLTSANRRKYPATPKHKVEFPNLVPFRLLKLQFAAFFRRIFYDFWREIVVVICGTVIFALLLYMAYDFLGGSLQEVSPLVASRVRYAARVILLVMVSFFLFKFLRTQRTLLISSWAHSIGSERNDVVVFSSIVRGVLVFAACAVLYVFNIALAEPILGYESILYIGTPLAVWLLASILPPPIAVRPKTDPAPLHSVQHCSPTIAALCWRLSPLYKKNLNYWSPILLAYSLLVFSFYLLSRGHGTAEAMLVAFIGGLFISSVLSARLSIDISGNWWEKHFGMNEPLLLRTYDSLAAMFFIGGIFISASFLLLSSSALLTQDGLRVVLGFAVAPSIHSSTMLQIDPTRPQLQVAVVAMIGILICTALYLSWAAVLLIPLYRYFAGQSQHRRYYRA